jgi:putative ABC transport system permease protein
MYRREWRSQLLMLLLLTVAVAGSALGVAATYNLAENSDATFGSGQHLMKFEASDRGELAGRLAAARQWFGVTDEIGHRYAQVPGLFDPVDIRAQDPDGPYSAPMLALREGRYPSGAGEIALTDKVAATVDATIGDPVALDGRTRMVVGLVENPSGLTDEFALVDPAAADPPQSVTVLVGGSHDNLEAFRDTLSGAVVRESRPASAGTVTAILVMAMAAVGLLLVSLVAAAGFVVTAQRRMRQLGMLAAMGATRRHLRLVMLANGAVVGAIAALVGTAAGIAVWLAIATTVETAAGHRIDRFDLPWALLCGGILLSVLTAVAAAWWPARVVARTPVMNALSARPPEPRPARRSAVLAVVLLAAGTGALVAAGGSSPPLIIGGTLATAIGMLFLGPLAIRGLATARKLMPVPVRLALTDLVRYRARSGAALAAISLALGIAAAMIIGSAASESLTRRDGGLGNLPESQLLVRIGVPGPVVPEQTPAQAAALEQKADAIAAALGGSTSTIDLDMAISATTDEIGEGGRVVHPAVEIGIEEPGREGLASYPVFVATDDLLGLYGLQLSALPPDLDVLSVQTGQLQLVNFPPANGAAKDQPLFPKTRTLTPLDYSSPPSSLITPAAMERHGWEPARVGWLIEADHPLTPAQLASVQDLAAQGGLTVESHREQFSLATLRNGATGAGALLALAVLASTVGLIRGESANDLRSLTAMGAPRRIRRALTAATAGALALLGALLGTACAYLVVASAMQNDLDALTDVPVLHLAATVVGVPLLATLAAWLLAGREPETFARRRMD